MCDNLDASATTVQHLRTAFRSDVHIEPPEEVPDCSESITSVGTWKVERKFVVRNVTESIVDNGQQADKGSEDAVERCRRIGSECEISRKDREIAEKQTQLRGAVEPER